VKIEGALLRSAVIAALGGLLFGFDTAVISGAEGSLKFLFSGRYEALSLFIGNAGFWHGFTVASALIGTIAGSIIVGKPADRFGRKTLLIVLGAFYLLSALGSALAWSWESLITFRFLGGLAVGGSSVVSPMYNSEISPARVRGRMVALTQFNIVFGILLAFFSNYVINSLAPGETSWRWMFGVEAVPALIFFLLMFINPRSPRWLVARDKINEARTVITRLGADRDDVENEIKDIKESLMAEQDRMKESLFQARYLKPILLAVAIAMFNQLSGINALMYYAPRIFGMAGFEKSSAMLSSVGVGFVNLVFTMTALIIIDHFGRRRLMLVGSVGYIISLGATALTFYRNGTDFSGTGSIVVLVSLLVFQASHAFGQGAVIWVFISEVFPNRVRARGQALESFTHWFMAAAISWTFPIFAEASGGHIFTLYAICMVGQLIWVLLVMPETKGITLEEMQKKLGIK